MDNGLEGIKNRSFHSSPGRRDWAKVIALEMQKVDWLGIRGDEVKEEIKNEFSFCLENPDDGTIY